MRRRRCRPRKHSKRRSAVSRPICARRKPISETQAADLWRHARAGTLKDDALRTQSSQAAIWIVTACVRVADGCYTLGGGAALYESSPLQRRLRDLHTAAQHAVAQQRHYVGVGKPLLDQAADKAKSAAA